MFPLHLSLSLCQVWSWARWWFAGFPTRCVASWRRRCLSLTGPCPTSAATSPSTPWLTPSSTSAQSSTRSSTTSPPSSSARSSSRCCDVDSPSSTSTSALWGAPRPPRRVLYSPCCSSPCVAAGRPGLPEARRRRPPQPKPFKTPLTLEWFQTPRSPRALWQQTGQIWFPYQRSTYPQKLKYKGVVLSLLKHKK